MDEPLQRIGVDKSLQKTSVWTTRCHVVVPEEIRLLSMSNGVAL